MKYSIIIAIVILSLMALKPMGDNEIKGGTIMTTNKNKTDTVMTNIKTDIIMTNNTNDLMDDDLFQNEIRNAAIEAAKEFGIDPDSTYIPFREVNDSID